MTIKVLIADDQPLVRVGLRTLLDAQPDISVAGEAADGASAVAESARLRPDVVLMDVRMPGTDGIEATGKLCRGPDAPRVLILTTYDRDEYVFDALAAGASGFLLKDARPEDLVAGVRIVAAAELDALTSREREVLRLVARGMSNAEIADALYVSENTVKTHVGHVLTKLGLRDRVQAVIFVHENRLSRE